MTTFEELDKLESDNKKLENLLVAFRHIVNLNDEDLQTDIFTCLNPADNDHINELNGICFLLSGLLGSRIDQKNKLMRELKT